MATNDERAPAPPAHAQPPRGINHLVLNVRNMEVSHRFWTEIMGFTCVAALKQIPGGRQRPNMRFYSGIDAQGDVTHHDLALCEVPPSADSPSPEEWNLMPNRPGINHVAITWPDRASWLKQLAFLRAKGVKFHRRVNHGMTHSVYISDPDGHGIEVLYELPREVWEGDIDGAQNYAEQLPTEGEESMIDKTDNPVFDGKRPAVTA
jgi:catechol 2,3-dioxygenase